MPAGFTVSLPLADGFGVPLSLLLAACEVSTQQKFPLEMRELHFVLLRFMLFLLFWSRRLRRYRAISLSSPASTGPPCLFSSADFISMFHSFMPRLLMKILNKIGSKINSSGIPLLPSLQLDNLLSASPAVLSPVARHCPAFGFVPIFIFSILTNDFPRGTVSSTLLKSRKIKFSASPLSKKSFILSKEAVGSVGCYLPSISTGSALSLPAATAWSLADRGIWIRIEWSVILYLCRCDYICVFAVL